MSKSFSKRIRDGFYAAILRKAPRHVLKEEIARRQINAVTSIYGAFLDGNQFFNDAVANSSGESGRITGELVQAIRAVSKPSDLVLLPGERRPARGAYSRISGVPENQILTAGLHEDMDFSWNYEESPPAAIPKVNLIASHAMIEHLINPYQHVVDCYSLLKPGGYMIFHTVIPGFQYHRYPIDCLRFFPDWFEEIAKRMGTQITSRSMSTTGYIVYTFHKEEQ
jgi:hypothetical protein